MRPPHHRLRPSGRAAARRGGVRALLAGTAAVALAGLTAAAAPADPLLPLARSIVREHPAMWTGASVARGEHAVVVGRPEALVAGLAVLADRGSRAVARVWGRPVDAVVLVPATDADAAALAAPARVEGLAALAGAARVIVEPSGFARLSRAGRQIVLTHELTHVATGAAVHAGVPAWLVEGFADYVGYKDSGLPVAAVAAELAAAVRASGRAPAALPGPDDFAARPPEAYEGAWLACRYVAEGFGERALVALYRAALREGLDRALRDTLGLTISELTLRWRAYVRAELAPGPP
ncbi:hypothetical protein GCM10009530_04570 [Microbispora corallina]|uniref:Peptidase MA-like domain-containing protein n=1 Tax=Microbispora corallina TaxID=83302 RepID=A0ABQ4FR74_9ACTN|nr:hypothetical protein [Microbispora corallina]GIH37316.1 hypothetical protein Mco01_03160 [Microbispora corallina]